MTAKDLIKKFEGLSLQAYPDPATGGSPWTIGYGHTTRVKQHDKCTKEQAEVWLEEDLASCYKTIDTSVKVELTNKQRDALASFIFNVGRNAFSTSTLLNLLNQKKYIEAAEQLLRWNKAGGKMFSGLTSRRKAERALFLSGTNINEEPIPEIKETPVAPFLAAAIPALISALPEFAAIFKKPDVADRNVEAAVKASEIIMQATGATNIQEAVEKVQTDPEVAQKANESLRMNRADLMDVVERVDQMGVKRVESARDFNKKESTLFGKWKFIHILSALLVMFTGAFTWAKFDALDPSMQSMVMTAIIIGGFTAVVGYWLGSSSGNDQKTDDLIKRIES